MSTEFVERVNLDELNFDDEYPRRRNDAFLPGKLMGVAVFGALSALTVYYVYSHLDCEKRKAIRNSLVNFAQSQVASFASCRCEDQPE